MVAISVFLAILHLPLLLGPDYWGIGRGERNMASALFSSDLQLGFL
jgi:hypothetical protein